MNKIVSGVIAATFMTTAAMAQSENIESTTTIEPAAFTTVDSYTFDLDNTTDPALTPLPADAGDYELATPADVETITSITFDLE